MISYLKTDIWAESTAWPSRPHRARVAYATQPAVTAAQRTHGRTPHSGSKPDPLSQIWPDRSLTRPEPIIIPVRPFVRNPNFFWIFARTYRTLGSHQIRVFHHRLERLVGREARRELEKALVHVLGAEVSPEAALTIAKHWPSHLTVAELHRHSSLIKVSINTFPSLLWSSRSKPHRKPTTIASHLDRRIGDERPRLEAEIPIH
jgi:hypothetical protein